MSCKEVESNSEENGLLEKGGIPSKSFNYDITQNESIFAKDFKIRFPRTDIQSKITPSVIKMDDLIFDYSIQDEDSEGALKWKKKIGFMLAIHFKLERPEFWELESFPNYYSLVKGVRKEENLLDKCIKVFFTLHRDRIKKKFKTLNQFFVHAIWLLQDQNLDSKNCFCINCCGDARWKEIVLKPEEIWKDFKKSKRKENHDSVLSIKSNSNSIIISDLQEVQQTQSKSNILPGVPLTCLSSLREKDFKHFKNITLKQNEGFRIDECVFYYLRNPIDLDSSEKKYKVRFWPAIVIKSKIKEIIEYKKINESSNDLIKKSKWEAECQIRLMGTTEIFYVNPDCLRPALQELSKYEYIFDLLKDVQNVPKEQDVELNLESGNPRPPIQTILYSLAIQLFQLSVLRELYTVINPFKSISNIESVHPISTISNSSNTKDFQNFEDDHNQYFQGIHFGLEKIWVGDLVRLRLDEQEVGQIIQNLTNHNKHNIPKDKINPDLQSPLILRIKAIYGNSKQDSNNQIYLAGDLYRIIISESTNAEPFPSWKAFSSSTNTSLPILNSTHPRLTSFLPSIIQEGKELPQSPHLPNPFKFQLVHKAAEEEAEVVVKVEKIAGRFYPSLIGSSFKQNLIKEVEKQQRISQSNKREDSQDDNRINLALAGLLPGKVKPMCVKQESKTYEEIIESSKIKANEKIKELISINRSSEVNSSNNEKTTKIEPISAKEEKIEPKPSSNDEIIIISSDEEDEIEYVTSKIVNFKLNFSGNNVRKSFKNDNVINQESSMNSTETIQQQNQQQKRKKIEEEDIVMTMEKRVRVSKPKPINVPSHLKIQWSVRRQDWFYHNPKTKESAWDPNHL